ncbi:MAG: hypothetical protein M0031_10140 [Thermaerobacter sp.]|nr:hypothetical protein [Thermaerobacter sp.]
MPEPTHDRRRCRHFARRPGAREALPPGTDLSRAAIFLCHKDGPGRATTMRKCRHCRDHGLGYVERG